MTKHDQSNVRDGLSFYDACHAFCRPDFDRNIKGPSTYRNIGGMLVLAEPPAVYDAAQDALAELVALACLGKLECYARTSLLATDVVRLPAVALVHTKIIAVAPEVVLEGRFGDRFYGPVFRSVGGFAADHRAADDEARAELIAWVTDYLQANKRQSRRGVKYLVTLAKGKFGSRFVGRIKILEGEVSRLASSGEFETWGATGKIPIRADETEP